MPPVTIREMGPVSGEDSSSGSVTVRYVAIGSDDYADVVAAIPGAIPDIYDGLFRNGIGREWLQGGYYYLNANFTAVGQAEPPPPLQPGDPERITWDTTGGVTVRRTHAPLVASYAGPGAPVGAPNHGSAINVTDEGPQGVDIEVGGGLLRIESVITTAQASTAYGKRLQAWSKKYTNDRNFRGFSAGEVRFMGGTMTERADGYWDLVRVFEVSENETGLVVAGVTGVAKKGHEYVWVQSQKKEDATNKAVVDEVVAVYVHEVFPQKNFDLLDP
jgi:hypothetical protein